MIRPKRNKKRFCSCVHKEYKAIKNGKPLRKNSKTAYISALRTCTKELKAIGQVRCGRIIKRGRPLIKP